MKQDKKTITRIRESISKNSRDIKEIKDKQKIKEPRQRI